MFAGLHIYKKANEIVDLTFGDQWSTECDGCRVLFKYRESVTL